jgi:hypothetical protein
MLKNANAFPAELYDDLLPTWNLGCLMLDTDNPLPSLVVEAGDEHVSSDPRKKYVRGVQN